MRETFDVKIMMPPHEASPYLKKVANLEEQELQEILYFSDKLTPEVLSDCFLAIHQMAEAKMNPEVCSQDYDKLIEYDLGLYDEFHKRMQKEGRSVATATEDDILVGDLRLEIVQMPREAFKAMRVAEKKEWLEHNNQLAQEFQKLIKKTQDSLSKEEFQRFLSLMQLRAENEKVILQEQQAEQLLALEQKFQKIGRRLSPAWRKEVLMNPWMDKELATEMESQGVEEDPKRKKMFEALTEGKRVGAVINKIREASVEPSRVGEYIEAILSLVSNINPFTHQKLHNLQLKTPFPYQEIADLLEQAYSQR